MRVLGEAFCTVQCKMGLMVKAVDLNELDAGINNRIGESVDRALAGKEPELW